MEMSHRGKEFIGIAAAAEADLRALLAIPDNYKVLFLQGGASLQFAAAPLNLVAAGDTIDHVVTGAWSKKAASEAAKFCNAHVAAKGDNASIPDASTWTLTPGSKFVHYCDNETIGGVEFKALPDVGDRLLIGDFSSNFLSKPVDVSKFAVLYAGAQKNVGPAGAVIVIVREDLMGHAQYAAALAAEQDSWKDSAAVGPLLCEVATQKGGRVQLLRPICPTMLDYKTMADSDSMYNTPPCWTIYVCGLVFKKLLAEGGLSAMQERNATKAAVLYDAIEASNGFYHSPVDPACRSMMNVPFTIPSDPALEADFVKGAVQRGLKPLKGHRSVGGMRASIYNAMPQEGVEELAAYMKEFQAAKQAK